ncbi:histidine kinase [Lichenicola cladoniae]|uniref:histidine kinase n=1 Tax=Lichenicola cladoniae TaxID=1484109 RepID=A0A6M8HNN0_9PROT|nr:sensor histidine kinase [Lichenicola cladoniae]NPD67497.1 histidine kinase [Acetobacteraceae bacterium]QKE89978.1 histidine kinase [Lichenicola cladoniae]
MVSPSGSSALVWDAERLRIASDAAGIALWSWNVDTDEIALDKRAHNLWAVPVGETPVTFEALSAKIHPHDLDRVRAAFTNTRTLAGLYEIDFRVVVGDEVVRWISARGEGADIGIVDRVMFGVFMDVTDRKQAEEAREMLAGEMSHRVKNLFALASALTGIAARSAATTTEMANDLTLRLTALGRAHSLVRSAPGEEGKALLGDLLDVLLAPYGDEGMVGDRITVSVPEIRIGETTATTIALVVHELATNSVKYGALSNENGRLDLSCVVDGDEVVMAWTERGGPPVTAPKGPMGFGSKLIARSVTGQLGGSIVFDWPADGAVVRLRMNRAKLGR